MIKGERGGEMERKTSDLDESVDGVDRLIEVSSEQAKLLWKFHIHRYCTEYSVEYENLAMTPYSVLCILLHSVASRHSSVASRVESFLLMNGWCI